MSRAPLNVSREMKLLLLLLLMVALIGLWYVWTGNRSAEQAANAPVTSGPAQAGTPDTNPTSSTDVPGAPGTDAGRAQTNGQTPAQTTGQANGQPDAAGTPPITVQPEGPVEVEVIPPFPASSASGEQPSAPSTPDGINPQGELAGVPITNPFQPLNVERAGGATGTPSIADPNTPAAEGNGSGSAPTTGGTTGNALGQNGGVLPITPVPGTPAAGGSLGGLPSIPGADGATSIDAAPPTSRATVPSTTITPPATTSPSTAGRNTATPQAGGAQSGGAQNSGGQTSTTRNPTAQNSAAQNPTTPGRVTPLPTDAAPIRTGTGTPAPTDSAPAAPRPPIAGVTVPRPGAATPGFPVPTPAGSAGTGVNGAPGFPAPAAPQTPQVITELGGSSAGTGNDASRLSSVLSSQELEFNAVVLGPVNTAIFKGRSGFVVLSVGQTLPDTNVTLKEVTADSATLALGNETQTLELEKR